MPIEEFRQWLWRQPFRAFRFYVLDGTSYLVEHPELVLPKLATIDLFVPGSVMPIPLAERRITIALRHVTRLEEEARSPASGQGNGNAGKA